MRESKLMLEPIFISEIEAEEMEAEYRKIVQQFFPNIGYRHVSIAEYKEVKENYLKGNKDSIVGIENVILSQVVDNLISIYLNYDMVGYDFYDALNDVYLYTKQIIPQCLSADYFTEYSFFVTTGVSRNFIVQMNDYCKKNLDVLSVSKMEKVNCNDGFLEDINFAERKIFNEQLGAVLKQKLGVLNSREADVVGLFYGLGGYTPKSLHQIGREYKLTGSAMSRNFRSAMRKLRQTSVCISLKSWEKEMDF